MKSHTKGNISVLVPLIGIIVFVILYVVATWFYPGGSNVDTTTVGFHWKNNCWGDLVSYTAKNGTVNPARPIALIALVILCSTLAVFWFYVSRLFIENNFNQVVRYSGISSMSATIFLFTGYHDAVINVAGILGIIALIGLFTGLYKNNLIKLFYYGIFCLVLMFFIYFIYQTKILISILPMLQKVTFGLLLSWFGLIDIYLYRISRLGNQ